MNLTPEQQIGLECASAHGVDLAGVALCVAGTLSVREFEKCRQEIGGHGCWGEGNDFRRVAGLIAAESIALYKAVPFSISGQRAATPISAFENTWSFSSDQIFGYADSLWENSSYAVYNAGNLLAIAGARASPIWKQSDAVLEKAGTYIQSVPLPVFEWRDNSRRYICAWLWC